MRGAWKLALGLLLFGVLLAWLVTAGIRPRKAEARDLVAATAALNTPTVAVTTPHFAAGGQELVLPASLAAYTDSPIYARATGYVTHWYADLGAHVAAGQTLAELDIPEVDQQLQQAQADLGTAQANLHLARITAQRYQTLLSQDGVSRQDADNAQGDLEARQAEVASAEANVKRLSQMQAFARIQAPFAGVITARNVDIGNLVDAGSSGRELFHVAAVSQLRVYANLPQVDVAAARPGVTAWLELPQYSGRRFPLRLLSTANAIDPATRTLLAQFVVENAQGDLLPGAYAELHLVLASGGSHFLVPESALIFRAAGPQLLLLTPSQTAHLQTVTLGRDFGDELEIASGLKGGERVVINPPDAAVEGEKLVVGN